MTHHDLSVYGPFKYVSVFLKETPNAPLHTTAYKPGSMVGDDYVRTDISGLPQASQDAINEVWTEEVYANHEASLTA